VRVVLGVVVELVVERRVLVPVRTERRVPVVGVAPAVPVVGSRCALSVPT